MAATDNDIEIIINSLTSDLLSWRDDGVGVSSSNRRNNMKKKKKENLTEDGGEDMMSHSSTTGETYVTHSIEIDDHDNTSVDVSISSSPPKQPEEEETSEATTTSTTTDNNNNNNNYPKVVQKQHLKKTASEIEKDIFDKAKQYLNPGPLFRFFTYLYAERKLLTFFWVHCIATLVVWAHFAMQKFDGQTNKVPEGANRYWWKVMVPTLEFGAMHAILFQMALIPLTMSRFTISSLSDSVISRFVPMNRMLRIHIHLGYIMVTLVFLSTVLFFTFFGLLCTDGEQDFCNKMKSEIMITGYIILAFLLILGGTSYFRYSMPYELFYAIHHLVFLLYIITIIHTFDREQRSGTKERSQTFKWFSSTLLYYVCDRAAMALNHSYKAPLVASSTVDATTAATTTTTTTATGNDYADAVNNSMSDAKLEEAPQMDVLANGQTALPVVPPNSSSDIGRVETAGSPSCATPTIDADDVNNTGSSSSKMIILRIRRPVLFHFKPGQYAQLRLKEIDNFWHPFSIASGPGSSCLEFYIEVFDEKSWSNKLWHLLNEAEDDTSVNGGKNTNRRIEFEVMGPYGTALGKMEDYSHAIAIGTGTGIVPVLSLFKQHVRQLLRLEPETFLRTLEERQKKIIEVECAQNERKGSIASKVSKPCCGGTAPQEYNEIDDLPLVAEEEEEEGHELSASKRQDHRRKCLRSSINRHGELSRWGDLRDNIKVMKNAAFVATRSFYGVVLLSAMPVLGVALFGLAISWNTCNFDLRYGMIETFQVLSVIFQALFTFVAFFIWDGTQFFALIDAAICVITPFADWYWFLQYAKDDGQLLPCDVLLYCILIGYMTARCWSMVVRPRHRSWRSNVMKDDGFGGTLDRLEMIWVTRSASLVSKIMPEIHVLWDTLVSEWGRENAAKVCRIAIHITDPNGEACEILRQELCDLDLYQTGAVQFGRPNFSEIIENHTLDMVATRTKSYSLLAFCGSSQLAHEIHHDKISNDMVAAITGNKQHQMEFVSESYGGYKSSSSKYTLPSKNPSSSLLHGPLSKRKTVSYAEF